MSGEALRIAMWSGPRNISTAMMRSFENRPDTAVADEPFYAAYLRATGLDHPMREAVLRSQPTDWRRVAESLIGPPPAGATVFYQKHMTHHMLPSFGTDWLACCVNVFLIRDPSRVVASYAARRADVDLADLGVARQRALFEGEAQRLGRAPLVIDAADVLAAPSALLQALCSRLGLGFDPAMVSWPAGVRSSDGVWAPAWYGEVERSTGFLPDPGTPPPALPPRLSALAEAARPDYEHLAAFRLTAATRTPASQGLVDGAS
jgi:hypothetical protein